MNMLKNDELVKMPLPERTLAVKELAGTSGQKADSALAAIAHVEGDQSAIQVLEGLNPIELGQILRGHDVTVPAISAWLADPKRLAAMLVMDPMDWENLLNDNIVQIQSNALNLLALMILTTDNQERQKEILETLAENDNTFFYLCFPFIGLEVIDDDDDQGPEMLADDDDDDLGDDEDTQAEMPEEYFARMAKRVISKDLSYHEMLESLMHVIEEVTPELAQRITNFISLQEQRNETWDTLMDHILDLRAAAQEAMGETKDDSEEYVSMFEVKKK